MYAGDVNPTSRKPFRRQLKSSFLLLLLLYAGSCLAVSGKHNLLIKDITDIPMQMQL